MKIIDKVNLRNFRCHKEFSLPCNKLITLIVGENGSGKTSVLEAIYLGLRGKSFKGVDREMALRGEEKFYRVELMLSDGRNVLVRWDGRTKEFDCGGKKSKRILKQWKYPVILFEPDDLHLIATAPGRRREYFDRLFGQMDEMYSVALSKYQRALKQKNDLLKKDELMRDEVFSWDVMLAKYGVELLRRRKINIDVMNQDMTKVYREIAKNQDDCCIKYTGEVVDEGNYLKILTDSFWKDRQVGYTSFGVHRDDYEFYFNGRLANGSASRGEIRSMVLATKFIEAKMVEMTTNKAPLVLLDDIFSELDEKRQKHLIENFKNYQMIITSTNTPGEMTVDKKL